MQAEMHDANMGQVVFRGNRLEPPRAMSGFVCTLADIDDGEFAFTPVAVRPQDGLAGAQTDQTGADWRENGHTPGRDIGVPGKDEFDRPVSAARLVDEFHCGMHRDDIGRKAGRVMDGGA